MQKRICSSSFMLLGLAGLSLWAGAAASAQPLPPGPAIRATGDELELPMSTWNPAAAPLPAPAAVKSTGSSVHVIPPAGLIHDPAQQPAPLSGPSVPPGSKGWHGTGHPDPEPLRTIPDDQMMSIAKRDDASQERMHALISIGRRKIPGALPVIAKALTHPEYHVKAIGLAALMEHGGTEALALLWKFLREDSDRMARSNALWGIALWGPDEALAAARYAWGTKDPSLMGSAVLASWAFRDRPELMPLLAEALDHSHELVWQEAIYTLQRLGSSQSISMLQAAYAREKDPSKRERIAFYLRQKGLLAE